MFFQQQHHLLQQALHLHFFSTATVISHGYKDPHSSSGIVYIPFPSSSLHNHHQALKFQHNCLSTLASTLHIDSWIIDSGVTTHVCSQLTMFNEIFPVQGVTMSFPDGTSVPITHT